MSDANGTLPGRGVISPASVEATFAPYPFEADTSTIGLGYNLHLDGDALVARKSGDHRGYKAIAFSMPEIGAGLVILANSDRAAPGIFADIGCPWSRALSGDPMSKICGQLRILRYAHFAAAGIATLVGTAIAWPVLSGLRRGSRGWPRKRASLRLTIVALLGAVLAVWWGYWYSDIPLRLQGFPPTFYTVRATLWPTAFIWVCLGLSALVAALSLWLIFPKRKPEASLARP